MTATTRDLLGLITMVVGVLIPAAMAIVYIIKGQ